MQSTAQTDFFSIIQERQSIKHFDDSHKLSKQEILELLGITNRAPSAWNLQHRKFLVITDWTNKEKLLPIASGQKQVAEASVTIVILGDLQANLNANAVNGAAVQAGLMPEDVRSNLTSQIEDAYTNDLTFSRDEAIRNASLAAMQLMLAAKAMGLDSCPIGGYDAGKLVEAFDVPSRYIPVMLVAIGKAVTVPRTSIRFPVSQTIAWNSF